MIDRLKPYPAYKDFGVPWLGEVPAHWEVRRTKTLFQSRKQLNTDGSETNVLSLTLRGVVNNDPDNPEGLVPKDYKTYQIFERDDLVFKLIDLENVRTSRVGLVHERGIMSPAYVRLTLSGMGEVRFYYQQFYDLYQRSIYNQIGEGVRSTIGWSDLANLRILAPSLSEQTAIIRFLDYMDRRMRRYIRAKQKLIKLLEEYRKALIHQVVTGKIDVRTGKPYPAYKDSGVEWLGQVPKQWEVRKLKYVVTFSGGGTPSKANPAFWEGYMPWVSPKDMKTTVITDTEDHISDEAIAASSTSIVSPGAVLLVVRSGILRRSIPVAINMVPVAVNQDIKALRPKGALVMNTYLRALIQGNQVRLIDEWTKQGATVESIEHEYLANSYIPLPPLLEQTAIVEYLDAKTAKMDAAIAAARREIELLREYRERLIADVVTGKVDVREVTAQLPEEPPEEEAELMDTDEIAEGEATDDDAAAEALSEEEVEP